MNPNRPILAECRPTLERIQAVLDRIHPSAILAADPHPSECAECRERVRLARMFADSFAVPAAIAVPAGFTEGVLAGVAADRRTRLRRRVWAFAGSCAAAAIALAIWFQPRQAAEVVRVAPTPDPILPAPAPPIRLNDELAKAGAALRESSRSLSEPAASTPKVFAALTDSLLSVSASSAGLDFGPAERTLAEIPDAARIGLEPVTGTAQKAFNRLLQDVSFLQPKLKS